MHACLPWNLFQFVIVLKIKAALSVSQNLSNKFFSGDLTLFPIIINIMQNNILLAMASIFVYFIKMFFGKITVNFFSSKYRSLACRSLCYQ